MASLTEKQRKLFESLHNSRIEDFKTFHKKSYRGVWSSIIDKYPESAHFVYELLQNADDSLKQHLGWSEMRESSIKSYHSMSNEYDLFKTIYPSLFQAFRRGLLPFKMIGATPVKDLSQEEFTQAFTDHRNRMVAKASIPKSPWRKVSGMGLSSYSHSSSYQPSSSYRSSSHKTENYTQTLNTD